MKLRKILSLGLAVGMTVSALAACGNTDSKEPSQGASSQTSSSQSSSSTASGEEKKEITFPLEEPVTITGAFLCTQDTYKLKDNTTFQYFQEQTGINFDITETLGGEVKEKWNLLIAGDSYPEFFWKISLLDSDQLGMDGVLIPVEDLIREYMPNLTKALDERNGWNEITAPDGHIYSLPNVGLSQAYGTTNQIWWLNQKWMDNLGLEYPTTLDDLYTVLKAFKDKDANGNGDPNDEIPWIFSGAAYQNIPTYIGGMQHYTREEAAVKDGKVVYYPGTDECKEWLAFMVKCYEEGLVYKDAFTMATDQVKGIGTSGDVLGMFYYTWAQGYVLPEHEGDYVSLRPFDEENFTRSSGLRKGGLAITDKCENPEILCAAFDRFYEEEEGGKLYRMGLQDDAWVLNADGTYSLTGKYENDQQYILAGGGQVPTRVSIFEYANVNKETNYLQWLIGQEYLDGGLWQTGVILPALQYTADEKERLSVLNADLDGYINNYYAEVITGLKSLDESWENHLATLKKMGADEYASIYQAAYDRATAK